MIPLKLSQRVRDSGNHSIMLLDILIAAIAIAIAVALGLIVHPVLWVIAIVAVLWLVARYRTGGRPRASVR